MKEQRYILENEKTFNPKHIFECGQCFRWKEKTDGSYTGIFGENVINVKKEENKIIFQGIANEEISKVCTNYFDLNRNYEQIKNKLSKIDNYMKESIEFGNGIRILNQELWETIISFILSANNNIPRIKGMIERISCKYGRKITYKGEDYYTFPTPEELSKASVEELRKLGLGFRDKRVYDTTRIILENKINLQQLRNEKDFQKLRDTLLTLPGVGPKVADCILLFSDLKRWEAFPIDVWVRRVMNELYIKNEDEEKVSKKIIEQIAHEKFGALAGIAQQYLFYWKKEA